jgi:hypothetical protein
VLELGLLLALLAACVAVIIAAEQRRYAAWTPWPRPISPQAAARAEALLRELLGAEPYEQLVRRGYLEVPSPSDPRRTYRIPRRRGTVKVYEGGVPLMALCVRSVEPIPDGDAVLLHKLMIEGNEAEYLRVANHFDLTRWGTRAAERPPTSLPLTR